MTELRIGPGTRRVIVDAVLTGVHDADTSHHALLGAFASGPVLERALARAEEEGLFGHEMGDAWLVWGEPRSTLGWDNLRASCRQIVGDRGASAVGTAGRVSIEPRARGSGAAWLPFERDT